VDEFKLEPASPSEIEQIWRDFTGIPIVTVRHTYESGDGARALVYRGGKGLVLGHVSWFVEGDLGEIVTIEAVEQGRHTGGRLIDAAEVLMREQGVKRVVVTTTNDNLRAQAFYVRRGYRLARIERDGMERVRALKPGVPRTGYEGLPLLDMWEFEKQI
jgi:N-acetylglutamate synthase-like GNAT family acetyltransferase